MAVVKRSTAFAIHICVHLLANGKLEARDRTGRLKGRHTHRDTKHAYDNLDDGNSNQRVLDAAYDEPIVGIESKDETEDVFEDDHQGEAFNREVSYRGCKRPV
jgi:hypothetical protein